MHLLPVQFAWSKSFSDTEVGVGDKVCCKKKCVQYQDKCAGSLESMTTPKPTHHRNWLVCPSSHIKCGPWSLKSNRSECARAPWFMTDQGQNNTWLFALPPPHGNKVLSIFIGWTFVGQPSWLLMASLDLSLYTHYLSISFATTRLNNEARIQNMT